MGKDIILHLSWSFSIIILFDLEPHSRIPLSFSCWDPLYNNSFNMNNKPHLKQLGVIRTAGIKMHLLYHNSLVVYGMWPSICEKYNRVCNLKKAKTMLLLVITYFIAALQNLKKDLETVLTTRRKKSLKGSSHHLNQRQGAYKDNI